MICMKYPVMAAWLRCEQSGPGEYLVSNEATGLTYRMEKRDFDFLMQLDGRTDPYTIKTSYTKEAVKDLLSTFDDHYLTFNPGIYSDGFGSLHLFEVMFVPTERLSRIFSTYDLIVSVLWLPLFLIGMYRLYTYTGDIPIKYILSGTIFGLVSTTILHEAAHAAACLRYGGKVWSFGMRISRFLPCAFTKLDTEAVRNRRKRAHVNAAGIEAGLLLTGIFLLLAFAFPPIGGFFLFAALQGGLNGIVNMLFLSGSDGINIVSEYLGCEQLSEYSREALFDRKKRKRLLRSGINGFVTVAVCAFIQLFRLLLPILLFLYLYFLIRVRFLL